MTSYNISQNEINILQGFVINQKNTLVGHRNVINVMLLNYFYAFLMKKHGRDFKKAN